MYKLKLEHYHCCLHLRCDCPLRLMLQSSLTDMCMEALTGLNHTQEQKSVKVDNTGKDSGGLVGFKS